MNKKRKMREWTKKPGRCAQKACLRQGRNFKSGETLAEVMVSIVIFLLLVALLEGSVAFCTSAQKKSREIRENTSNAIVAYWNASNESTTEKSGVSLSFHSKNSTDSTATAFTVKVNFNKESVSYKDTDNKSRSTTFYTFGNGATTSAGTGGTSENGGTDENGGTGGTGGTGGNGGTDENGGTGGTSGNGGTGEN